MKFKKIKVAFVILMMSLSLLASLFSMSAQAVTPEDEVEVGDPPEYMPPEEFSDVGEYSTYFKAVDYLRDEGVVVGYEDGSFGLDKNINRAEFLKIVMETSEYEPEGEDCFKDVTDQWYAPYICKAADEGFVDGYSDGSFKPEQEINFAEASKIITNILGIELGKQDDEWFTPYVVALETTDSIPADVESFDQPITRGEMAEMIWRIDTETTYKVSNTYANISNGITVKEHGAELMNFESCTELGDYFEDNTYQYYYYDDYVIDDVITMDEDSGEGEEKAADILMPSVSDSEGLGSAEDSASEDYSTTNVQVEGVDEADIIKNDGKYIYLIKGNTVRIVDAYPPSGMKELSTISFQDTNFYPSEMYVDAERMVVIGSSYDSYTYLSSAKVYIMNIADKNEIELLRTLTFENGYYNTSRKIDGTVYLVLNQYNYYLPWEGEVWTEGDLVPQYKDTSSEVGNVENLVSCGDVKYMPGTVDVTDYTIMAAIPVEDAEAAVNKEVIIGAYGTVYASTDNLYIAEPRYNYQAWYEDSGDSEETYIHKFALDETDISYKGVGTVKGTVLNQFSMDESGEYFRIATTKGWGDGSTNNVYVLDGDLKLVGSLEGIAPGESIYSVRFMGNRVYMVTFEQLDPLFVIDLTDPTKPVVLGELEIPGVSDYLHPYDENHLIGFGLDSLSAEEVENLGWSWFQGLKISMFDVTDVNNPVELHKVVIGDRGTYSELLYNHKALLFDKEKGIMALPVLLAEIPEAVKNDPDLNLDQWVYGEYTFQGAYVYDVSVEDGFTLKGTISHYDEDELGDNFDYYYSYGANKDIQRILYIGDFLYTVSQSMVEANEIETLDDVSAAALGE